MYSGYFFLILQFRQIKQINIKKLKLNQEGKKYLFIFLYIFKKLDWKSNLFGEHLQDICLN